MNRNWVKQLIYGTGFLAVLALIFIGGYFLFFNKPATCFDNQQNSTETGIDCGGLCASCEIKNAKTLSNSWVRVVSSGEDAISLLAEIKNPNLDAGANDFIYNLNIFDKSDNKIKTLSGHSFIYPSEVKYLVEITDISSQNYGRSEMEFSQVNWQVASNFKKPNVFVKNFKTNIYNPEQIILPLYTFTRDLTTGLKGEDIKVLQDFLSVEKFYTASSTGTFDAKTKNALIAYQKANQIVPAVGYFGGVTRNQINAKINEARSAIPQTGELYPVTIGGIIKNDDIVSVSRVIVSGLIFDNFGTTVGASKTELENFLPTDEKEFSIVFPKNIDVKTIDISKTKLYVDPVRK